MKRYLVGFHDAEWHLRGVYDAEDELDAAKQWAVDVDADGEEDVAVFEISDSARITIIKHRPTYEAKPSKRGPLT